jgi:hypothetical protein
VNIRDNQREALISPDTGLRAAATLALLAVIAVVLNIVKDALGDNGFAAKLIAATPAQAGGVTWPTALVISVLMVAMTTVVMGALWSIWGIVRQD